MPYKMNSSAVIAPSGRKAGIGIPGMYLVAPYKSHNSLIFNG
jgi:hypothetical protein